MNNIDKQIIEKINSLSKSLDFNQEDQTFVEMRKTDDKDTKELHLKNGSWQSDAPWFVIDQEEAEKKAYAFMPSDTFLQMIKTLKEVQKENFDLKLEKTIWQNVPIDFEDVWVVVMEELREKANAENSNKPISLDLDRLLKDIKKEHPNLFINIKEFIPQQIGNK